MIKVSSRLHNTKPSQTIHLDSIAKQLASEGKSIINLSSGELDFETPDPVLNAAKEAITSYNNHYTKPEGMVKTREAVSNFLLKQYKIKFLPEQVIITNGAKQALYSCMQVLINEGDEVLIPVPGWVSYIEQVKLAGGVPVAVETTDDFLLEADAFDVALTDKTVGIILNYPNNPTGAVYSDNELTAVADFAREHNLWVVSDEIYSQLLYDDTQFKSFKHYYEDTIIVNGVSKSAAMTGWRVGFAAGPANVIEAMRTFQTHVTGNVCNVAQLAGAVGLLLPGSVIQKFIAELTIRRDFILEWVDQQPKLSTVSPQGAFYFFLNISEVTEDSEQFCEQLQNEFGITLVPGKFFGREGYIRLSFANSLDNIKMAVVRIDKLIEKYQQS